MESGKRNNIELFLDAVDILPIYYKYVHTWTSSTVLLLKENYTEELGEVLKTNTKKHIAFVFIGIRK